MEKKTIRHQKIIPIIILSTVLLSSIQSIYGQLEVHDEFTVEINPQSLTIPAGGTGTSVIYVNFSLTISESIILQGDWIGNQPQGVLTSFSKTQDHISFISYLNFSTYNQEFGQYIYQLSITGETISFSKHIYVNISNNNIINFQTDKLQYEKGEQIDISGNISLYPQSNIDFADTVSITLQYGDWKRCLTTQMKNTTFEYSYNISYGDPEGNWNIAIIGEDIHGRQIQTNGTITVNIPSDKVRYKIVWFSPPKGAIYSRGSTIDISVYITEDNVGVKNAITRLILPNLEEINLTEITQGYYKESYVIPFDISSGPFVLTAECVYTNGTTLKVGGSTTSITIIPATIQIDLIEPTSDQFVVGETIDIVLDVTYPNASTLQNGTIQAVIFNDIIPLHKQENGLYSAPYTIKDEHTGSFFISFTAKDIYDNSASFDHIIHLKEISVYSFPLTTFIIVSIIILLIASSLYYSKKYVSSQHYKNVEDEIKEIQKLQDEAAVKYYKTGSITRQTYDLLRKDHTERLEELKKTNKNPLFTKSVKKKNI